MSFNLNKFLLCVNTISCISLYASEAIKLKYTYNDTTNITQTVEFLEFTHNFLHQTTEERDTQVFIRDSNNNNNYLKIKKPTIIDTDSSKLLNDYRLNLKENSYIHIHDSSTLINNLIFDISEITDFSKWHNENSTIHLQKNSYILLPTTNFQDSKKINTLNWKTPIQLYGQKQEPVTFISPYTVTTSENQITVNMKYKSLKDIKNQTGLTFIGNTENVAFLPTRDLYSITDIAKLDNGKYNDPKYTLTLPHEGIIPIITDDTPTYFKIKTRQ